MTCYKTAPAFLKTFAKLLDMMGDGKATKQTQAKAVGEFLEATLEAIQALLMSVNRYQTVRQTAADVLELLAEQVEAVRADKKANPAGEWAQVGVT